MRNVWEGLKSVLRALYYQFGEATTSQVVTDTESWIEQRRKKIGVYGGRRGPWRETVRPAGMVTSKGGFQPILKDVVTHSVSEAGKRKRFEKFVETWVQQEYAITLLRNASVCGEEGMVISTDGEVFNEFYHGWSENVYESLSGAGYFKTTTTDWKEYPGSAAVISVSGWDSYYHFLLQSVVRISLLKKAQKSVDKYILPKGLKKWHINTLKNFGLDREDILSLKESQKIMVRRLYAPTVPMVEGSVSRYGVELLREGANVKDGDIEGKSGAGGKVYIVRGGRRRRVANEEQIVGILRQKGWVICDGENMSFEEQVNAMKGAEVIVGAHGAGLTNMVFTKQARVLEVFPADHIVPNCYDHLAERCGHEYYWLVAGRLGSNDAFQVSRDRLLKAIEKICEGLGSV